MSATGDLAKMLGVPDVHEDGTVTWPLSDGRAVVIVGDAPEPRETRAAKLLAVLATDELRLRERERVFVIDADPFGHNREVQHHELPGLGSTKAKREAPGEFNRSREQARRLRQHKRRSGAGE